MDDKTRAVSAFANAHRARAKALKEMMTALFRWLNTPLGDHPKVARSAEAPIAPKR